MVPESQDGRYTAGTEAVLREGAALELRRSGDNKSRRER